MTEQPPEQDPIQTWRRCNEGHDLFMVWIKAFMNGHPDTKHLRENYNAHLDTCPLCRKADRPR